MRMCLSLPHSFCPHFLPPCSFFLALALCFLLRWKSVLLFIVCEWMGGRSEQQKTEYGAQEAWQYVKEKHVSRKTEGGKWVLFPPSCVIVNLCEENAKPDGLFKTWGRANIVVLFTKFLSQFSTVFCQFGSGYRMPFIVEFASVDYIIDIHSVFKSLSFWITLQTFPVQIHSGTCFKIHLFNDQSHLSKRSKSFLSSLEFSCIY